MARLRSVMARAPEPIAGGQALIPFTLDRTTIAAGGLQDMALRHGARVRVMSPAELDASLEETLAHRPGGGDVWLFAYGSLIWNPAFHFAERQVGTVRGWHRRFCLSSTLGRGTPDCPGLVLGLDRGGACRGVAFRIPAALVRAELAVVWCREMLTASYTPRWARVSLGGTRVPAIVFTINRADPHYAPGLDDATVAARLAVARGEFGAASDYLFNTLRALDAEGIIDVGLHRIARHVRLLQAEALAPPPVETPAQAPT
ncbi:ChaC-like protein [Rhodospirillum rubrum ATCC 11170]|uniref:glutathione-specific gamma-glutamylcyclotransferase n=1 Tax=Rhodospirillum rubrum (strain ATCC 11170 / ATH 1.1.1 / DSM 467 / LMG 4362 / NCIMB 8255 / S1) TaxID=269796 RepID=Q2RQM2_RHORT|nr:ChaC-like protein [Rhodospirillum rubrum ATCC 11170]MBK5955248.1 calcium transporter ChaC [Rhodospirillum rubrum]HCF17577.1 calcium transporter ChaC [Rhodospirillum rubrum]